MPGASASKQAAALLMVEDDKVTRALIEKMLAAEGVRVIAAEGESDALLALETYPGLIPLLFIDVRLGKGNGFEMGKKISGMRPDIRIIYLSAHLWEDFRGFAKLLRVQDVFLPKPFQAEALRDLIRMGLQVAPLPRPAEPA